MQNKKLLSVVLALVLVCTCITGMLILNVNAEADRNVAKEITLVNDSIKETLATLGSYKFAEDEYAQITLEAKEYDAEIENGLLFGTETFFVTPGERLPITITGAGSITFKNVSEETNVACANSYTFKDIGFYAADAAAKINFYAGSGEVVLDGAKLIETATQNNNVNFYADNFTAAAFAGWDKPAEPISTSLTLRNMDYTWATVTDAVPYSEDEDTGAVEPGSEFDTQVNGVGWDAENWEGNPGNVTAADTRVALNIENSQLSGVHARSREAVTPIAELTLNITGEETTIDWLTGVGNNALNDAGRIHDGKKTLPDFDFTVNIENGTFTNRIMLFRGVAFDGDMTVNISGGSGGAIYTAWGDGYAESAPYCGYVGGTVTVNYIDGSYTSLIGPGAGAYGYIDDVEVTDFDLIPNRVEISGGTLDSYYGTQGVQTDIVTTVTEGTIGTYVGTWNTGGGGATEYLAVQNNISGGTITTFYGTGGLTASNPTNYHISFVQNNLSGGTIATFYGTGNNNTIGKVENNFYAATVTGSKAYAHGTFYAKNATLVGPVLESVTTNAVNGAFPRGYFYAIGCGEHNCDVVVNSNLALEDGVFVPSGEDESIKFARCYGARGSAVVNGDFTWNITGATGHDGECRFGAALTVNGDYTLNYTGRASKASNTSNFDMGPADGCTGDVNVHLKNVSIKHSTAGKGYNARVTMNDVGGDINFVMENSSYESTQSSTAETYRLCISPVAQDGNVSVTYIDSTVTGDFYPHDFEVGGTFEISVGGTNNITDENGETVDYPFSSKPVGKLVNNLLSGTFADGFCGTGAATINEDGTYEGYPVGSWVTTEVEGEPVTAWVPGDVENNIYADVVIGVSSDNIARFFGTGDQVIGNVVTNMYGGRIYGVAAAKASRATVGCYYGNLGEVTGSVTNNIYSGSIGNNFFGSNGDLTCPVYTNIGNGLYTDEELSRPTIARAVYAGGNAGALTADGYTADADVTGTTGYTYLTVNGANVGYSFLHYNRPVNTDAEGYALKIDFTDLKNTSGLYPNVAADPIVGNVDVKVNGHVFSDDKEFKGYVSHVNGDVTLDVNGLEIQTNKDVMLTQGDVSGDISLKLADSKITLAGTGSAGQTIAFFGTYASSHGCYEDTTDLDGNITLEVTDTSLVATYAKSNGTANGYFRDVAGSQATTNFGGNMTATYARCTLNFNGGAQYLNRNGADVIMEFDSCTFLNTHTMQSQNASGTDRVYIYGETTVGNAETTGTLNLGYQPVHLSLIGAKYSDSEADNYICPTETTLNIAEGSKVLSANTTNADIETRIYDVVVTGNGWLVPNLDANDTNDTYDYDTERTSKLTLVGNLMVVKSDTSDPYIYLNAAREGATVTPVKIEENGEIVGTAWKAGAEYVYTSDEAVLKLIKGRNIEGCTGYGVQDVENLAIVGAAFEAVQAGVQIDIQERIYVKLLLNKEALEAYLTNMAGDFTVGAVFDDGTGTGAVAEYYITVTQADLDKIETVDGTDYVKVLIGAVAAKNFDKKIAFSADATELLGGLIADERTLLTIAETGAGQYENATEGEDLLWKNLYTALYNYGAAACGESTKELVIYEDAANDPLIYVAENSGITFTSMELLMGDAIGIRFNGTPAEGFDADQLTMKYTVGGVEYDGYFNIYDGEDGEKMIDVYVSLENVDDEILFKFYYGDEPALAVQTSIKGYTEWAKGAHQNDLLVDALADLAQAVYNYNTAN